MGFLELLRRLGGEKRRTVEKERMRVRSETCAEKWQENAEESRGDRLHEQRKKKNTASINGEDEEILDNAA